MNQTPNLTTHHVNASLKLARRWARNRRERENMEGVAILALVRAWRKWQPERSPGGGKDPSEFFAYILRRVRWAINVHIQHQHTQAQGHGKTIHSLDAPLRGKRHEETVQESIGVEDPGPAHVELADLLDRILADENRVAVRCLRLAVDGLTHRQIGRLVGLTKSRVSQKIAQTVMHLRYRYPELVQRRE